ncbi:tetraspanin-33-like isoform X1 [Portunus trituberculatus]|uniref:tetraspanin-33-like isoform X1 n=1 Tax=Portunus trituberculatus TaxID=210409 RepID=UPI001E1D0587|nr:tetraspanin-33-like isoform X1 [Portunus trituberculatus]
MARRRDYSYISPCVKWTLFAFNFIFWLFGLLLVGIGLYGVVFTAQDLHGLKSVKIAYIVLTDLSGVMVALGSIIFVVSFAGCIGALRENLCLLKLYFWSLTIFLVAELIFAIGCILFPWKSREIMESLLSKRLIEDYRESQNTQNFVDSLQRHFECCGITTDGYQDWNANEYFNCSDHSPSAEKCGVPASCCIRRKNMTHLNSMCGYDVQKKKRHEVSEIINPNGCVTSIIQFLESNLYWAAGVIFGITLFQMYVTHQARSLMDQIALQRSRWESQSLTGYHRLLTRTDAPHY